MRLVHVSIWSLGTHLLNYCGGRRGGVSLHPSYTNPVFGPQMSRLKYTYPVSLLMPHRPEKKVSGVSKVEVSHEIMVNNKKLASV